ncbi:nuclear transport factor 2 family protein [Pokkaliibacter sp. CJK22405]|uniref:nuclear transport factor 2 family protein n=1 Tax=Pokkaliibacter sp. CJK22405 TaxID=3384615 RepID=UPI003985568D
MKPPAVAEKSEAVKPEAQPMAKQDNNVVMAAPDATPVAEAQLSQQQAASEKVAAPGATSTAAAQQTGAASTTQKASIEDSYQSLLKTIDGWKTAWSAQNADNYLSYYATDFTPADGESLDAWKNGRRSALARPSWIKIELGEPQVAIVDSHAIVRFDQHYQANNYEDKVVKELEMVKENGEWKIKKEDSL